MIASKETTAILNQTKTPFWSLGGRRRDREEVEEPVEVQTSADVSSKLGNLMDQLDAGIAQSAERERAVQSGRKRESQAAAAEPAQVAEPAAPPPVPVETPKVELGVIEPEPAQATDEVDPATVEALRLIADQRKAAEALLVETRALEDQIKNAAAAAQASRLYEAAAAKAKTALAKAESAAAAEVEARQRADGSEHDHSVIANELKSIEAIVAAKRKEADAAKAEIAEIERQLGDLQRAAQSVLSDLTMHESRARECGTREGAAARSAAEAAARAAARKTEREAAEAAATAARERAESLEAQLPSSGETGAMEDLQRLTERITEQVKLARSLRNGSLHGYKAS